MDITNNSSADTRQKSTFQKATSRRQFLAGLGAAAAAAAFLAACSSEDDGPTATASATSEPTTTTEATSAPESGTIDYVYGEITTTIPRNPQRVVVMEGRGDLDFALSVGYPVVATGTWNPGEVSAPFVGKVDDAELIPNFYSSRDYEYLVSLQPDLIVQRANAFRGDFYGNAQLQEIAPVLSVEVNRANWRSDLEEQAKLLGRDQQVAEQLAEYDAAVQAAKDEVGALLAEHTIAMTTVGAGLLYIWCSDFPTEVGNELGMQLPFRNSPAATNGYIEYSDEGYGELAEIDLIFAQGYADMKAELAGHPTWSRLPAEQAGHVVDFPGELNNGMALTAKTLVGVFVEGVKVLA